METRVDCNFNFDAEASEAINSSGAGRISFPIAGMELTPHVGDLYSIEELMPHVFIVKRRHFHWVDPHHLQIDLLLGLAPTH